MEHFVLRNLALDFTNRQKESSHQLPDRIQQAPGQRRQVPDAGVRVTHAVVGNGRKRLRNRYEIQQGMEQVNLIIVCDFFCPKAPFDQILWVLC